jgi:predicted anti-sigma-YlaC factor YlaD
VWREALSARLDGEDFAAGSDATGPSAAALDAHLAGCADCRGWARDAAAVTRLARLSHVDPAPGVPAQVLDLTPRPTRARVARALRAALAALGAGQILLAVAELAGPMDSGGSAIAHMTHEFAAWNAALGAAFVFVAWRRTRPAALLPMLTAFVAVLVVLSGDDIAHGLVRGGRLASHVLILVGYALVVALSRPSLAFGDPPGRRRRDASGWRLEQADEETPGLRPVPEAATAAGADPPAAQAA